jgi:hypothetical protein
MQTGIADIMEVPTGKADSAGQLDAFNKAENIHPNFD